MADFDGIDGFDDQVDALESSLGGAQIMTAAFDGELKNMASTISDLGQDVNSLSRGISRGLRKAFDGLIFDGMRLSDAMRTVATSMVDAAYSAAIKPVTEHLGGLISAGVSGLVQSIIPYENGGAFTQGRVTPFAAGGVVSGPVTFPMRGGVGLMGEAGPEAIMPLSRGADGKLGVRAQGGTTNIVMNITTPDVEGFRRSQSQIAAQMQRALSRGQRHR